VSARRFVLLYVAPVMLLLAWRIAPLAAGGQTLFLRDVLNAHLPMKWAEAQALRAGELPLLDPYRAAGQPLLGNPNAVPFYPDNLLYVVAPLLWALNAHFWLHLLLAPFALYALARALGLARTGAWAAGVCYAFSGYFAAQMSFYNLVAGVALAPALAAAVLATAHAVTPARRGALAAAAGLLWALLLTAGDPQLAALALALAVSVLVARPAVPGAPPRRRALALAAAGLACGTLVALPQIVEFLRIVPLSFRGYYGYSPASRTIASFDPRQALEWLIPFAFGRPDRLGAGSFWGYPYFTDTPPYYFTLYPGLLALALVAAAVSRRRDGRWRVTLWAVAAAGTGLFFSLGRFNPLVDRLLALGPADALRYPIKFWLPVAVGGAVLCGVGFERAFGSGEAATESQGGGRPGRLLAPLAALGALLLAAWVALAVAPAAAQAWLRAWVPSSFPDAFVANERLRWSGLCMLSVAAVCLLIAVVLAARRRPVAGGALLLAVHAAVQLFLLAPAMPTDETAAYRTPPALLADVPADAFIAHGSFANLFGPYALTRGTFPAPQTRWIERRAFAELYPFAGPLWGRRYALDVSPEGLDSFYSRLAAAAVERSRDADRVRLLAAWGADLLLLDRPLATDATAGMHLLATRPSFGRTLYIYRVDGAAPEVAFATHVIRAPHMNAAVAELVADDFDPRTTVVLPRNGDAVGGGGVEQEDEQPPGPPAAPLAAGSPRPTPAQGQTPAVTVELAAREHLEATVRSSAPGVLVWRRAWLPLYRATVDGATAPTVVANLQRLGVEVPAGEHRVEIWTDRRPLARSALGSLAGLVGLLLLAFLPRRRRRAAARS
jgi:hypothetical protein